MVSQVHSPGWQRKEKDFEKCRDPGLGDLGNADDCADRQALWERMVTDKEEHVDDLMELIRAHLEE